MADFGRVLAAVDGLLGTNGLARYMDQRGELQREAAEGDRIGSVVLTWMTGRGEWEGTATDLLSELTPERPPKDWPGTPRALSGALRRVAQPLRAAGVMVVFVKTGHQRTRVIRLEDRREERSAQSADRNPSVNAADAADAADGCGPTFSGRLFDPELATDDDGEVSA